MKRFRRILRIISLVFFVLLTTNAKGQTADSIISNMDDVEVSLLTCGPGNEVYSLFGHTAIRVCQPSRGMDIVVNYGMFSFKQKYFILRFVLGLTDYQMGITTFDDFKAEYEYEQRWVFEQTLNLTSKEKSALLQAIDRNYKPENVTYRYNFFYNNCTTKARDLIAANIDGKIKYNSATSEYPSFRELCHSKTFNNRWSQFGNDLLLGIQADLPTNISEQQFLPENLEHDFSNATIETNTDEANNTTIGTNKARKPRGIHHSERRSGFCHPRFLAFTTSFGNRHRYYYNRCKPHRILLEQELMAHGCHSHASNRIGWNDTLRDDILEASYRQHQFPNPDSQPYRSLHGDSYGEEATQGNADMVAQNIRFLPLPGHIMRIIPRLCRGY